MFITSARRRRWNWGWARGATAGRAWPARARPQFASAKGERAIEEISRKVAKIQDGVRLFHASSNCISLARKRLWPKSRNSGPTSKRGKPLQNELQRKLNSEHPNHGKLVKSNTTNAKDVKYGSTFKSRLRKNADAKKEEGEEEERTRKVGAMMSD
ncbi:hypothetical protein K438DRAFT_1937291 [Mycena galopus ATCC 62051]|nr:hypothetical protein K438DRAFT_1937291 [Mycena galopus ATCC 62051]